MCLKVIENGKHKDVHIKEGEVSSKLLLYVSASYFAVHKYTFIHSDGI